jgi:short subunit dehydrogenase-like uncharacterized protein
MISESATSSRSKWLLYGANGYTGKLTAHEAKRRGMTPVLAGRNRAEIETLAAELGFEARAFALDDPSTIAENLKDIALVLHCAGPFSATARPMLEACARASARYLDITGEIAVFEYVHQNDAKWKQAGIIAMPGVGFDVVPTDCLAAMLKRALPDATHLRLAFKASEAKFSPGTSKTMVEGLHEGTKARRDGKIVPIPFTTAMIPFVERPEYAVAIPWGDVSTAYYSTGIPNIEVYLGGREQDLKRMNLAKPFRWLMSLGFVQSLAKSWIGKNIKGPSDSERAAGASFLWGEATNAAGQKVAMRLRTPEGYTLTVDSSLAAVDRVLKGGIPPGALTPSMAFGADFVLGLNGATVTRKR